MKLSKPQRKLLESLTLNSTPTAPYYPPAVKLVEFGFAEWGKTKRGSVLLYITYKGRKFLEDNP